MDAPAPGDIGSVTGLDVPAVSAWLAAHVTDFDPPYRFHQILGGSSNLTFRVHDRHGNARVLRRPPVASVLASAHDMAREFRVMSAIADSDVPVPRMDAFCDDHAITGADFYVMEYVDGVQIEDEETGRRLLPSARPLAADSLIDALVSLHAIDPEAVGLGDLGRPTGYVARQLRRWLGQWEQLHTGDRQLVPELHDRLVAALPDDEGPARIVHGDPSFRNSLFRDDGQIVAVLDWEICTLGDPLADLGYVLASWSDRPGTLTAMEGFPDADHVADRYATATGVDPRRLPFYVAFNHWKTACIIEGVYARYHHGALGDDRMDEAERYGPMIDDRLRMAEAVLATL